MKDKRCECVMLTREDREPQRDWLKRCFCMYHWMQTNYYRGKRKTVIEPRTTTEETDV